MENAKDVIPDAPMEVGNSATMVHQSQRPSSHGRSRVRYSATTSRSKADNGRNHNVMEHSKLTSGPAGQAVAATTKSGPLVQEGMHHHGRGRNNERSSSRLTPHNPK